MAILLYLRAKIFKDASGVMGDDSLIGYGEFVSKQ
jgi:hypothetical protein